jgi:WD40 repeat protein
LKPLIAVLLSLFVWSSSAWAQKPELTLQKGHNKPVVITLFSPDGRQLLSRSSNGTIKLWDAASGKLLRSFIESERFQGITDSLKFSPDGKQFVANSAGGALRLWDAASGELARTFRGHDKDVFGTDVVFHPNGQQIASLSNDKNLNTIKIWDVASGKLLRSIPRKTSVGTLSFHPDGRQLVTSNTETGTLDWWDVSSGKLLRTISNRQGTVSLRFSPNGEQLLSSGMEFPKPPSAEFGNNTMKIWDVSSGKLLRTIEAGSGSGDSGVWSPDGKQIISVGQVIPIEPVNGGVLRNVFQLWDAASGKLIRTFKDEQANVQSVEFSPDGGQLVVGKEDGAISLWDTTSGQLLRTIAGYKNTVDRATFSADGQRLATSADGTFNVWNTQSNALLHSFNSHKQRLVSLVLSPDGNKALSNGWYDVPGQPEEVEMSLKLWDTSSGKLMRTTPRQSAPKPQMAFSPDGKQFANTAMDASGRIALRVWDVASGRLLRTMANEQPILSLSFSADGKRIVSGDDDISSDDKPQGRIKIWDVASGKLLRALSGHPAGENSVEFPGGAQSVSFSADGKKILSGGGEGAIKLWDAASGKLIRSIDSRHGAVYTVKFSLDGSSIISSGVDGTMRFWNSASGQLMATLHTFKNDWAVVDAAGRFDGSPAGLKQLHYVAGLEVRDVEPATDANYEAGLLKRILGPAPDKP